MRPQCTLSRCQPRCFNPRTPCGVRLNIESSSEEEEEEVSIHALLAECDHQPGWGNDDGTCFNPRTPCGVRQSLGLGAVDHGLFQSTHSLRSATQVTYVGGNWDQVSIHALLAECDALFDSLLDKLDVVSIHALLAECDADGSPHPDHAESFNPRTRESATAWRHPALHSENVSIHALVRVRLILDYAFATDDGFQSTHS